MVVPPQPQTIAMGWKREKKISLVEIAEPVTFQFVGNRQHYAKAVDSRFIRLFINFLGAWPNFWSPRAKHILGH